MTASYPSQSDHHSANPLRPSAAGKPIRNRTTANKSSSSSSAKPYARTPKKQNTSSFLNDNTPTSFASLRSLSMFSGIFSLISPFRSTSRARQSAAFGHVDLHPQGQDQNQEQYQEQSDLSLPDASADEAMVDQALFTDDERVNGTAKPSEIQVSEQQSNTSHLSTVSSQGDIQPLSSSRASRASAPLSPRWRSGDVPPSQFPRLSLQSAPHQGSYLLQTPQPSTLTLNLGPSNSEAHFDSAFLPPSNATPQQSPVSRNYDLLARFFAEKQRQVEGALTEVEVEGCIKLIQDSMAAGRDLAQEFDVHHAASGFQTPVSRVSTSLSSRASFPASHTYNGGLFHPGSSQRAGAFSFLAPRSTSTTAVSASGASRRHRPLYLGPGMSSSQTLSGRRRTMAPSKSLAESLSQSKRGWLPQSTSDPSLNAPNASSGTALSKDDAKRRRMTDHVATPSQSSHRDQVAQFDASFEQQRFQSSALAKQTTAPSLPGNVTLKAPASTLKRPSPSSPDAAEKSATVTPTETSSTLTNGSSSSTVSNGVPKAVNGTPVKPVTRTASAMLDILKESPPVRPPVQPELVNPYQTTSPLAKLPKKPKAQTQTPSKATRTTITTRAKAKETAEAAKTPKKESVLDLIERTAPKSKASKRSKESKEQSEETNDNTTKRADQTQNAMDEDDAEKTAAEARKAEKTEEARRRLESLTKSRNADKAPQQPVASSTPVNTGSPPFAFNFSSPSPQKPAAPATPFSAPASPSTPSHTVANGGGATSPSSAFTFTPSKPASSTSLAPQLPPQYTASKPKKPSPLSAAFQMPDSPSSESEKSSADSPIPLQKSATSSAFSFALPPANKDAMSSSLASLPHQGVSKTLFSTTSTTTPTAPPPVTFSIGAQASKPAQPVSPSPTPSSQPAKLGFSFSPVTPVSAPVPAPTLPVATTAASEKAPPATTSAARLHQSNVSETGKSPESDALLLPETSLPRFDFELTSTPVLETDVGAESIQKEILSVATLNLPKFDFVVKASTIGPNLSPSNGLNSKSTASPPVWGFNTPASIPGASAASPATSVGSPFSFASGKVNAFANPTTPPTLAPAPTANNNNSNSSGGDGSDDSGADGSNSTNNSLLGEGQGEEDEEMVYEARGKLWKFDQDTKTWKDLGIGMIKLKRNKQSLKRRLLVRNEANGKVVVNFHLYSSIKISQDKNVLSFLGFDMAVATQYRCKIKTQEGAQDLKQVIEKEAAA